MSGQGRQVTGAFGNPWAVNGTAAPQEVLRSRRSESPQNPLAAISPSLVSQSESDSPFRDELFSQDPFAQEARDLTLGQPRTETRTLNVKEQFRVLGGTPANAGEQIGLSGLIFNGEDFSKKKNLEKTRQQLAQSVKELPSSPTSAALSQESRSTLTVASEQYDQVSLARMEQARKEIRQMRRAKNVSAGAGGERLVINQITKPDSGLAGLLEKALRFAQFNRKRQTELQMQLARSAKKQPKGPVGLDSAKMESRGDMVADMQKAEIESPHERSGKFGE